MVRLKISLLRICSKLGKRSSCLDCLFNGIHRFSDCTIGDFWGVNSDEKEEYKGISALLVHSEKFSELLKSCDMKLKLVDWKDMASDNPNLYFSHSPLVRHFISRKIFLFALRKGNNKLAAAVIDSPLLSLEMKLYNHLQTKQKQKKLLKLIK